MKAVGTWDEYASAHASAPSGALRGDGWRLQLEALASRWRQLDASVSTARRLAALGRYTLRTLAAPRKQLGWLRFLHATPAMRQAVRTDPRLYDRWHRDYICTTFTREERRQAVSAHYRFMLQRFPARLNEKLLKGHAVRLATLVLDTGELAHVYLRQSHSGQAGELDLFVVNADKEMLASCVMTFAGKQGLIVGAVSGSWAYMGHEPVHRFIQGSHGVRPRHLLISLLRTMARAQGIDRIRGVSRRALPNLRRDLPDEYAYDRFWIEHGGVRDPEGCFEIPRDEPTPDPVVASSPRGVPRHLRESFRDDACALMMRTLGWGNQKS
ncbi:hypothetical protein FHW69_000241 [Luteibacter sp. Sphag1AF]|uniref:DUF535 family protein n=1 Tax=Luteibacter sp. Sphag1AF TaxID=2587031 RepID=UPI00162009AF|nr:DUF535 family protein [Luteibacter sp. Sphag1AF]MBB3225651.1 hypothetical protein [Luteibacter sp. Sphag1AF]